MENSNWKESLLRQKFKNQFYTSYVESFKLPNTVLNFQNPSTGTGDITSGARDLFHFALNEKLKKRGKDCLVMIDN